MKNTHKRVAILVAELYEDSELLYPYYRMLEAGYQVDLVGCEADTEHRGKKGTSMTTTVAASEVDVSELDAVIVPGGYSPDHMRRCQPMVDLVRTAGEAGATVASICHGPWMLASAGLVSGRRVTSFSSIRDDLVNAGAEWVDEATVTDGNLITARTPDDLPSFMRTVVAALAD
jgi:protease I